VKHYGSGLHCGLDLHCAFWKNYDSVKHYGWSCYLDGKHHHHYGWNCSAVLSCFAY
jgi:hypothetical protein